MKYYSRLIIGAAVDPYAPILLEDNWLLARAFWQHQWPFLIQKSLSRPSKPVQIFLVDPDEMLVPFLFQGLLHNLFSLNQHLEYHILTDQKLPVMKSVFQNWNPVLMDTVCFNNLPDDLTSLISPENALLIFFHEEQRQFFAQKFPAAQAFLYSDAIQEFSESMDLIKTSLILLAKQLHLNYLRCSGKKNPDTAVEWDTLDTFHKCSNISSASITEVWSILREFYPYMDDEKLHLSELEHIRWWRCMILLADQNEQFKNGHQNMMVPFNQLELDTQELDTRNTKRTWPSDAEQY